MKTRTSTSLPPQGKTQLLVVLNETEVSTSDQKRQKITEGRKSLVDAHSIQPWTNIETVEYMATFKIQEEVPDTDRVENTIQTTATRYTKKIQESITKTKPTAQEPNGGQNTGCSHSKKEKRISARVAIGSKECEVSEQYRIDDTSMGFSWWSTS